MENGFGSPYLLNARVAILGLGLMGGSLAMALRGHCREVLAADPDPEVIALARRRHIVDHIANDPAEVLPEADLVILAAPVRAILELIPRLPAWHPGSPVVIDLGSTKTEICARYADLPERFEPLGGHPMCGKETGTLANADPTLYQGATFAFTSLQRTGGRARSLAEQLVRAVEAHPLWLTPETHDRWTAATSHLPYLIAAALALATPDEVAPMVGPGFRGMTRLAGSSPAMMESVLATNRDNLLDALARFRASLAELETYLSAGNAEALQTRLDGAVEVQRQLRSTILPGAKP